MLVCLSLWEFTQWKKNIGFYPFTWMYACIWQSNVKHKLWTIGKLCKKESFLIKMFSAFLLWTCSIILALRLKQPPHRFCLCLTAVHLLKACHVAAYAPSVFLSSYAMHLLIPCGSTCSSPCLQLLPQVSHLCLSTIPGLDVLTYSSSTSSHLPSLWQDPLMFSSQNLLKKNSSSLYLIANFYIYLF